MDESEWQTIDSAPTDGTYVFIKSVIDYKGNPVDPEAGMKPSAPGEVPAIAIACRGRDRNTIYDWEIQGNSAGCVNPVFVPTHWKRLSLD